jgi:DoxX-like protein
MQDAKRVWSGRVVSVLAVLPFVPSATMKLLRVQPVVEGFGHLGLPEWLIAPLGILELLCVAVYAVPRTSVLGAILMTGFIGGTIVTHLRMGEPIYMQSAIGILVWLGLWLRDPRLRALLPVRNPPS